MDIIIKRASLDNIKEIQELNNQLFELEYNNFDSALRVGWPFEKDGEEYFAYMLNNEIVLIAITDNNIIGYLAGSINCQSSYVTKSLAEIDNMFVIEEYRKIGLGSKLINEFKKYCFDLGIEEIKVTASAKNINAINFYKKNGFDDFEVTFKMKSMNGN